MTGLKLKEESWVDKVGLQGSIESKPFNLKHLLLQVSFPELRSDSKYQSRISVHIHKTVLVYIRVHVHIYGNTMNCQN